MNMICKIRPPTTFTWRAHLEKTDNDIQTVKLS